MLRGFWESELFERFKSSMNHPINRKHKTFRKTGNGKEPFSAPATGHFCSRTINQQGCFSWKWALNIF
jgi:hypothetical protein